MGAGGAQGAWFRWPSRSNLVLMGPFSPVFTNDLTRKPRCFMVVGVEAPFLRSSRPMPCVEMRRKARKMDIDFGTGLRNGLRNGITIVVFCF